MIRSRILYHSGLLSIAVIACLIKLWAPAHAQSDETKVAAMLAAWKDWTTENKASKTSIAISINGKRVASQGIGRGAEDPVGIASLSKAITGVCIANLVNSGKLDFQAELSSIVPELKSAVNVGHLLSHASGFKTDVTQSGMPFLRDYKEESLIKVSNAEIAKGSAFPPGKEYHYNNSNYIMLGAIISKLTGKSYEEGCRELALAPLGIKTARLNPFLRALSAAGAWEISAIDFLKFVDHTISNSKIMGTDPFDLPKKHMGRGANYGLGTIFRKSRDGSGRHFWHFGLWDYGGLHNKENFGAYFAKWANGFAVVVNYNVAPSWPAMFDLDTRLVKAAYNLK